MGDEEETNEDNNNCRGQIGAEMLRSLSHEPDEMGSETDEMGPEAALSTLGFDDAWPTKLTIKQVRRRYIRMAFAAADLAKGTSTETKSPKIRCQELSDAYA